MESWDASFALICTVSVLSITNNGLAMIIISILDGYNVNQYIRRLEILMQLLQLTAFYYIVVFYRYKSIEAIGTLFGYPFAWHSIATSCMTSAVVFLVYQLWRVMRNPYKLVIVPSYIPFKFTNNSIFDNNIHDNMRITIN